MARNIGRKTVLCAKCGAAVQTSNLNHSETFRCRDCPRVCCSCGVEFALYTKSRYGEYRCAECMAKRQRVWQRTAQGRFRASKEIAKRRGIAWDLSFGQYAELRDLPCHYCGHSLPETGLGIDRVDCSGVYSSENVVPCCFECNIAKGSIFDYGEMLILGQAIAIIKDARLANGTQRTKYEHGWGRPRKYVE